MEYGHEVFIRNCIKTGMTKDNIHRIIAYEPYGKHLASDPIPASLENMKVFFNESVDNYEYYIVKKLFIIPVSL